MGAVLLSSIYLLHYERVAFPVRQYLLQVYRNGKLDQTDSISNNKMGTSAGISESEYNNRQWTRFRHAEMLWHLKGRFRNMKRCWVCQNICKCLKLNRPRLRLLSIVFRTWLSTAVSIEFQTMAARQSDRWISVNHVLVWHLSKTKWSNYPKTVTKLTEQFSSN